ncbi:MAG: alpha/beta hydrolase [Myxococcota bacterium]
MTEPLGFEPFGSGAQRVLVLHDWMGDHRNYDPALPYLDGGRFTYVFADLRGYGLSRGMAGRFDLREAADDVIALAARLRWPRFQLVGHSMSTLVAQQVAASRADLVASMALVAPIAPTGMQVPPEVTAQLEALGGDPSRRAAVLGERWRDRLSPTWLAFKLRRWAESADPVAAQRYVRMFATGAVAGSVRGELPVLALIGEHDAEPFRDETVRAGLGSAYPRLEVQQIGNAGHYPMQETPVAFATALERFLGRS